VAYFSKYGNKHLQKIFINTLPLHENLRGSRIVITGGTGFIGSWVIDFISFLNIDYLFDIKVVLLSRSLGSVKKKLPHIFNLDFIEIIASDILHPIPNTIGHFDYFVHGATDASKELNDNNPLLMFDTIISGTRNVCNFLSDKNYSNALNMSSGAVYGVQPDSIHNVSEIFTGGPDFTSIFSTYAEAKRGAELIFNIYRKESSIKFSTARIFALLGPGLSLNTHFAAGNFIRNAIACEPIKINGSGLPVRSYLHPVDLTTWLLFILVKGDAAAAYNVGSPDGISIKDLALRVSSLLGPVDVDVKNNEDNGWNIGRYVPDVNKIINQFNLPQKHSLDSCIIDTYKWSREYEGF